MSRFFMRRTARVSPAQLQCRDDPIYSVYSCLLQPEPPRMQTAQTTQPQPESRPTGPHRRIKSSPTAVGHDFSSRSWLGAAEGSSGGRYSGAAERPPPRKLVKSPNGSARPSFSVEISDGDDDCGGKHGASAGDVAGVGVRRKLARLKQLYWKGERPRDS